MQRISAEEFARRLKAATEQQDKRFAFFLGAGCSVTSGIPAAGALVKDVWLPRLRAFRGQQGVDFDAWATSEFPDYDSERPSASYGVVMDKLFLNTPGERQREIERLCDGRFPGFGYAALAGLAADPNGRFNVILTTNFDDLAADAMYLFTESRPLVIPHESLAEYIRPTRMRPLVVKLHGDHRLSPHNTAQETAELKASMERAVRMLLHDRGLIFIGYGGNDLGISKMLSDLPANALQMGIYWTGSREPECALREWLESRSAVWVEKGDFDELMVLVKDELDIPHPDRSRLEKVFDHYGEAYARLTQRILETPDSALDAPALKAAAERIEQSFPDWWSVELQARRVKDSSPEEAQRVYEAGLGRFPRSAPLLGSYALFLKNVRRDYDRSEDMYKRAIDADPAQAINLGNYALFLKNVRQDGDRAEDMYKRAIDADPTNARNLGNYAVFLENIRQDYDKAEEMHRRAIESDPSDGEVLCNFAGFLLGLGKRDEGLDMLRRARAVPDSLRPSALIEIRFYEFAHDPAESRHEGLHALKALLANGDRSPGWDLSLNVERAVADGHPDTPWLPKLAAVIADEAPIEVLAEWDTWTTA